LECREHNWVYDYESQENICGCCGFVEGSGVVDKKLIKDEEFKLIDWISLEKEEGLDFENQPQSQDGFIVPKATNIDFSNGGFLSTTIDPRNVDSQGKSTDRSYTNKLKYNHNYILSSMGVQQTYKNSIWRIKSYSDKLGLPIYVQERAADVFKRMYHSKANIHNSNNMVCACIYFACKEHNINKKLEDIAMVSKSGREGTKTLKKSIFLCYQDLIFLQTGETRFKIPRYPTMEQDISYVGNKIGLPEPTIRYAMNILLDVKQRDRLFFSGKSSKLTSTILLYISALIHNDFLRDDVSVEIDEFCSCVGTGISQYILKKRAEDYLNHEYFEEYKKKKEAREIII